MADKPWLKKVHVIASQPTTVKAGGQNWRAVQEALKANGIEGQIFLTSCARDAVRLARESRLAGATMVISAGGDGTIHEIVNGLMEAGSASPMPVLGIMPMGRGNDYYRGLRSEVEKEHRVDYGEAARRLTSGTLQKIDLGKMERIGRDGQKGVLYFDNSISLGFAADVTKRVDSYHGRLGGATYDISLFMSLLGWKNQVADILYDANPHKAEMFSLNVAVGKFYGSGMYAAPLAKVGDGLLDVVLFDKFSKMDVIKYLPNNRTGDFASVPKVKMWQARTVKVEGPEPILIQADGEFVGSTPLTVEIVPGALEVVF